MMTYRWIVLAIAATMLGGAAWYFGRPEMPKKAPVDTAQNNGMGEPSETPKELPPKLIEVIDLASAYEPVREPQSPSGVDPASFIEDAKAPSRIPYAADEDNSPQVCGCFLVMPRLERIAIQPRVVLGPNPVRLDVMPRVMPQRMVRESLLDGRLELVVDDPFVFTPSSVPFAVGIVQPIPPNASTFRLIPLEELKVMPRVVPEPREVK